MYKDILINVFYIFVIVFLTEVCLYRDRLYIEGQLTYSQIGEGEQSVKITSIIAGTIFS